MLTLDKLADIVFECESGEVVKFHSSVLTARSSWFNTAFKAFLDVNRQHLNCFDIAKQDNYFGRMSVTAVNYSQGKFHFQTENISIGIFKELSK